MKGDKKMKTNSVINEPIRPETLAENQVAVEEVKANKTANTKQKPSKQSKNGAKSQNSKDNAFIRFFKRIGRAFKEMGSELKKVSWPTFAKALASTGVVLAVVAIFLLVLTGFDALLGFGFTELINIGK